MKDINCYVGYMHDFIYSKYVINSAEYQPYVMCADKMIASGKFDDVAVEYEDYIFGDYRRRATGASVDYRYDESLTENFVVHNDNYDENVFVTVLGVNPGRITINFKQSFFNSCYSLVEKCTVIALSFDDIPGDVDSDEKTTADGALCILQRSVDKKALSDSAEIISDIDQDGIISAADALLALQLSVGKIEVI